MRREIEQAVWCPLIKGYRKIDDCIEACPSFVKIDTIRNELLCKEEETEE